MNGRMILASFSCKEATMFHSRMAIAAVAVAVSTAGVALAQEYPRSWESPNDTQYTRAQTLSRMASPELSTQRIISVKPYFENQRYLRSVRNELRGARIRVEPAPGVTAEWLQFQLEHRAATMAQSGPSDSPLAVPGVRAHVASAGDHFLVTLKAKDMRSGKEVLQRAEAIQTF
jgi:hypothetical protein